MRGKGHAWERDLWGGVKEGDDESNQNVLYQILTEYSPHLKS